MLFFMDLYDSPMREINQQRARRRMREREFDTHYINVFRPPFHKNYFVPEQFTTVPQDSGLFSTRWPNQRCILIFQGNSLMSLQMDEQRQDIAHALMMMGPQEAQTPIITIKGTLRSMTADWFSVPKKAFYISEILFPCRNWGVSIKQHLRKCRCKLVFGMEDYFVLEINWS